MSIILDASVLAALLLPDEHDVLAESVQEILENDGVFAPKLLWYEVRNTLLVARRRGRISEDELSEALAVLQSLSITLVDLADSERLLRLARKHDLSVYDAAYLTLALERGERLATSDKLLTQAAQREGILFAP